MTAGPLAQPERQGYLNLTQHPQTGKSSKRRFVLLPHLPCLCYRNHALTRLPRGESHTMPGLLQRLLTGEEDLFDLFAKQAVNINAAASRFVLYRVDAVRAGTLDLVKVLVSATAEVESAVRAIETPESALKHCIEINRYENESDRLCRTLIAQLFDEETDPVQIIKWKEIFEVIETAVDKCEDVANVVEGVVLKSA